MLAEWNRVSAQWFLPRYFGQRKIIKELRAYALRPVKPEAVNPLLHQVIRYREELEFTDKYVAKLPSLFGRFGRDEEWETINQIICEMSSLHSLLLSYSKDVAKHPGSNRT